jgi:aminopeptidase N
VLMSRDGISKLSVLAHEIAHQWFYGLLGNDQIEEPWIDESFAVFSSAVVRHRTVHSCASRDVDLPIDAWPAGALEGEWFGCSGIGPVVAPDGTLSYEVIRPEKRCPNPAASCNGYFETVYLRGAVFLQQLRARIGDRAFFAAARSLIAAHRHGFVTGAEVLDHFRAATTANLEPLIARFTSH